MKNYQDETGSFLLSKRGELLKQSNTAWFIRTIIFFLDDQILSIDPQKSQLHLQPDQSSYTF